MTARPDDADAWTVGLAAGQRQPAAAVRGLVEAMLDRNPGHAASGAIDLKAFGRWLTALADAGETSGEIIGVAEAVRGRMLPLDRAGLPAGTLVADTCGTGGDGSGSFNISTAASIVVAAAGQPVAKHGNRAVSSRTGSADVLAALGVRIDAPPAVAARCLREIGLCFCLAPAHHPALAAVGPLRKSLGRPTVFNLVGPLCNPAGADVQVIGVARPAAREPLAEAARALGARRTLVVSATVHHQGSRDAGNLDEVSLFGPTDVIDVGPHGMRRFQWTPEAFGLATRPADEAATLVVADALESAAAIRGVLAGERGPRREVVVLNAAAVLWAAGRAADEPSARHQAEAAIDTGAAADILVRLVAGSAG
jgi:anthranilate phosphoribosyltransferase